MRIYSNLVTNGNSRVLDIEGHSNMHGSLISIYYLTNKTNNNSSKGSYTNYVAIRSVPGSRFKSLIKFLIQYPTLEILHRS